MPGVLSEGLVIIAGKPEIGKSSLGLALGLGIAGGGNVLGSFEAERGNVLYIAPGESELRLQGRLSTMLIRDTAPPEDFEYATNWPCMDDGGLASLEE